jgi:hypothetical protein
MKLLGYSLSLLVAASSSPAIAAQASATFQSPVGSAESKTSRVTAAALARTIAPMDVMLPLEIEQARKMILALPTMDEDAKQLEQEYPGLYAAVWTAVEPEMRRQTEADYPSFWTMLEDLYIRRLTEQEAQAVLAFFKSPTGQKLMRSMYGSLDATPWLAEMVKSESSTVSAEQMQGAINAAKAKAVQQIGPEDEPNLSALAAKISLEEFRSLGAETQKLTLDWVNKEDPEGEEKIAKIMEAAMERYMDAHPPKD